MHRIYGNRSVPLSFSFSLSLPIHLCISSLYLQLDMYLCVCVCVIEFRYIAVWCYSFSLFHLNMKCSCVCVWERLSACVYVSIWLCASNILSMCIKYSMYSRSLMYLSVWRQTALPTHQRRREQFNTLLYGAWVFVVARYYVYLWNAKNEHRNAQQNHKLNIFSFFSFVVILTLKSDYCRG